MPSKDDTQLVISSLQTAGYGVRLHANEWYSARLDLHYRNSPDGTIRWVWMAGSRRASCLRFYHGGTPKGRLAAFVIRRLFRWHGEKFFADGGFHVYMHPQELNTLLLNWGPDFSLFTGTPGPNRKTLIWRQRGRCGAFIKLSANCGAQTLIDTERKTLLRLRGMRSYFMHRPELAGAATNILELEDMGQSAPGPGVFSRTHDLALTELYIQTAGVTPILQTTWWTGTRRMLHELKQTRDLRLPKGMIYKLERLAADVDPYRLIPCSLAHGDFTPWNMTVKGRKLCVYDWELSVPDAPAMWDAFHYVFQTGVLLHRHTTAAIMREVSKLKKTVLKGWLPDQEKDMFDELLSLYLLTNVTYYLHLYSRQPKWHRQVEWLLRTWNEALNELLVSQGTLIQRQLLCIDLFDQLRDQPYAALKWMDRSPESLSTLSDIDICILPEVVPVLDKIARSHPFAASCRCRERSFVKSYSITLRDGSFLSVDALWQFKRKAIQFLDAREMLDGAWMTDTGVKMPGIKMDFAYTWLFYLLNHASMPERYQRWFRQRPDHLRATLDDYVRGAWPSSLSHFEEAFDAYTSLRADVMKGILRQPCNNGARSLLNRVLYWIDALRDRLRRDGITITFSGVDGAGKSTIINHIRQRLEKQFRKRVVVLRHRPSLLPILSAWRHGRAAAEEKAVHSLLRQGNNFNRLSSLFRFGYYLLDYLLGQLYIQIRYVWRGCIVVYDRYYFDFINDSRRSNIHLPPAFTAWFYKFLIKPRLNFFLYAPAEDILRRKQELDVATIRDLTGRYLDLFDELSRRYRHSKYIPIRNIHLDNTLDTIVDHVKRYA